MTILFRLCDTSGVWFLDRNELNQRFWRKSVVGGHVRLDWPNHPGWTIELVFADIDGRTECVGMAVVGDGTEPLVSTMLRRELPLARLIQRTRRRAVTQEPDPEIRIEMWTGSAKGIHEDGVGAIKETVRKGLSAPDQRRRWPEFDADHYQRVADAYDFAIRKGRNTTEHVQETLDLSTPGQARKHIWRARNIYKLLPDTDPRVKKGNEEE